MAQTQAAQWHSLHLPKSTSDLKQPSTSEITTLFTKATSLYEKEVQGHLDASSKQKGSSSESSFLSKVVQSGTLSDRLSALTLLVQSDPVHNAKALETLKGMAERGKGKGGREESLKALRCIADWWVGGGAPNRKLKYFRDQPLLHPSVTDQHLALFYFEDWLKKYFFGILQILENLSLDPLSYVRTQSLALITNLLREKPEQEHNLLRLLVNKLGDPEKSICSRASYHILQVLQTHPSMKTVVVREISALILRPTIPAPSTSSNGPKHIRFTASDKPSTSSKPAEKKPTNTHARYYGTITLNQVVLSSSAADKAVASLLLDVYFDMFRDILGEDEGSKDDEDEDTNAKSKHKGKKDDGKEEVRVDKKGRILDKKKRQTGKDKEHVGAAGFTEVEDSNSRLISAILTGINRALPFAKLDDAGSRIEKHIDTLFLITHTSTFNTSLQALVLIQQISVYLDSASSAADSTKSLTTTAKTTKDRYYRALYASLHDPRLADSSKQAMYLNLLFKSIKQDVSETKGNERIIAIIRRFVQILASSGNGTTEFVAGGLYLLGELFSTIPGLRSIINLPAKSKTAEEEYDPKKRDPQFAHASSSPLWELTPLLHHYHPAVALHARQLLTSQPITASADLSQNTLSHFLNRFVYKNAKKPKANEDGEVTKGRGASAMQPAASGVEGVKLIRGELEDAVRMNDPAFLRKRMEEIPVDQRFFYEYFSKKSERDKAKSAKVSKRKGGEESSGEDEEDEEVKEEKDGDDLSEASEGELDEDEVWKAMQASMSKAGDDDDIPLDSDEDDSEPDLEGMESESKESIPDDEEDNFSLVEGSDNEDLLSLNDEVPDGLTMLTVEEDEEWGGIGSETETSGKRKRKEEDKRRKKKLRALPTFASYEDYAKLIEDGPEDDI